ncbi:succinate dehydrogenase / fumarate reductase cytochrome b subunit [Paenibacillus forsythiae]|uniref:Succinate dehydrogenase / fumarate reductase cytochrome b subunit n=1 Tax=Paenibacillus forsythiae TaxID=365616 RepID=A0ABU3HDR0_9BACL|nr:succinate dehydrogenase cytochrome b558 subunit [Paenibacillus forsythiae]MDT3428948.1 succinate dehydrogenase / fumarate reductase cytochrome b subunit [Paenibacillus forsythiae]
MRGFYSRKIHSLLGVIPLAFFFIEHMLTNFSAVEKGADGFKDSVLWLNSLPLVFFLELLFIWLPLMYHGVYGLYIAYQSKPNLNRYNLERNWRYTLQRVSGIVTFVFIIWHLYETRVQVALGNVTHEELGGVMHEIVTQPLWLAFYIVGIVAACFHFANGLWSFLVSWGITIGPRSQRVSSYICMGLFVLVTFMFLLSLVTFRDSEFKTAEAIAEAVNTVIQVRE